MRYFDLVRSLPYKVAIISIASGITMSILLGQSQAPYHFRMVGREASSDLPYLRAFVKDGNMTLIKNIFPDLIESRFNEVFEPYISQDALSTKIESIETQVSESRDLEIAKGFLAIRERNIAKAKMHFDKASEIDPTAVLPLLDVDINTATN